MSLDPSCPWMAIQGRQMQGEAMRTHTQGGWYPDQSGWSQGGQTDLVGQKCSETPPSKCLLRWKYRSASRDILQEVFWDHVWLLSSASSALIASTPVHFQPMSTGNSHRIDESWHPKFCVSTMLGWPSRLARWLSPWAEMPVARGHPTLSVLSALRAGKKNLPSLCAWIEAQRKEIGRQQHSMENPILGLSARQDKRHPMLFQSLQFIHHRSLQQVKGFWPQGKGYLTFHNRKRIYSIFCLVQFNFTLLKSSLKPLTSTFWNSRRAGKHTFKTDYDIQQLLENSLCSTSRSNYFHYIIWSQRIVT